MTLHRIMIGKRDVFVVSLLALTLLFAITLYSEAVCALGGNVYWVASLQQGTFISPDAVITRSCSFMDIAEAYHARANGDHQAEIPRWTRAVKSIPTNSVFQGYLADALFAVGDYAGSYSLFAETGRFDVLIAESTAALDAQDQERAFLALSMALPAQARMSQSQQSLFLLNWARYYQNIEEIDRAGEYYQKAIAANPNSPIAYRRWGALLTKNARYVESAQVLETALTRGIVTNDILATLGANALQAGDLLSARAYMLRAIAIDPNDSAAADYTTILGRIEALMKR